MMKQLKCRMIYYLVSGVLLSFVVAGTIMMSRYHGSLQDTVHQLERVQVKLSEMETASDGIDRILFRIKRFISPDFYTRSVEEKMYLALDEIKSLWNGAQVSIADLEDKGEVVSLPVHITGSLVAYAEFINNIGTLMDLKFPFFTINDVSLSRRENEKGAGIHYVIHGALQMPKQ
jgi:hypothetical protein